MLEFRWLLEELLVNFFAQELRTPPSASNRWRRLGAVESLMPST
jgi:hypothetical protein